MTEWYRKDVAYIHDVGHADFSGRLRRAGFQVRMIRAYGGYPLAKGHAAFVARKAGVR